MKRSTQPTLLYEETTKLAIGAFFDVNNELGGFPEFVLRRGLAVALADAGLTVREEVPLPVWFRGRRLTTFKADLIVDPGVIIEVKTAPELLAVHKAQLMHYLKATRLEIGLLFNFGRKPEFARVIHQRSA
ncbi:MAG TPA: GxxExxY protein [Vicinamibacterales bacterium]|jgi:GxxExxY protein